MAEGDLESELRGRAQNTADAILRSAKVDADRIATDAEMVIEARRSAVLTSREEEYRAEARANVAGERHEAMRAVLLAKTRVVDRVMAGAKALLPAAARGKVYGSALADELGQALAFVGEENAVVQCPDDLAPVVREALRAASTVVVESTNNAGSGFVAIGDGGTVRVDGTLEARLDRLAPTLAIEILAKLEEL